MSEFKNIALEHSNDFVLLLDSVINKKYNLIEHHLKSINNFYDVGIEQIISRGFNIEVDIINERDQTEEDRSIDKTFVKIFMYNVKIDTPETINNNTLKTQKLLPNVAHMYDKTYNGNVYVDVDINVMVYKKDGTIVEKKFTEEHFFLSKIPIMVKSNKCNLYQKPKEILNRLNEDPMDIGGYFIIKSVEWCILNLESIAMNNCRQFKNTGSSAQHKTEICRTDFISKPGDGYENSSHIVTKLLNKNQIIFEITNNRLRNVQIPFYVLYRAFGIMSDKQIMESIVYKIDADNDETNDKMKEIIQDALIGKYKFMENSTNIYSQTEMLEQLSEYIYKNYIKAKTKKQFNTRKYNAQAVLNILDNDVLPHIGVLPDDRINKTRFLGHMIHRLLLTHLDIVPETDRDSYGFKRVTTAGTAFAKFFKSMLNSYIVQKIQRKFLKAFREKSFSDINILKTFHDSINSHEFNKSLVTSIVTGDKSLTVGGQTKPNPISSQQLHRKNQLNVISVLRSINTNSFTNAKQSTRANVMRRVQPSMIGYICTVQSLDSSKVGIIKQMAISATITLSSSSEFIKDVLYNDEEIYKLDENLSNNDIYDKQLAKVFVNGYWLGCCDDIFYMAMKYRTLRRKQKIHFETTIVTDILFNELHFYVDNGRILRPLLIVYSNYDDVKSLKSNKGFHQYIKLTKKHLDGFKSKQINLKNLLDEEVIEYVSPDEQENLFLASNYEEFLKNENNSFKKFTHVDIPQAQLGLPTLTGPLANYNQVARAVFQGNQIKQSCSVPNLNFGYKSYKDQYIHVNNEYPLVKTMVTKYFPAMGQNAMVSIAIYEGYNQDDSLIINQSSIDRGLVNSLHYSFIKTDIEKNEEIRKADKADTMNIKSYYNYEKLVDGIIPIGAYVEKDDVVIGKISKLNKSDMVNNYLIYSDQSIIYKNLEPAYIWDIIQGKNEDGKEFIKIIYYQYRKSDLGNKFSSRSGQKGTIGMVYSETDMPFTKQGVKPDIIFSPMSLPTRMTMSVPFEGVISKYCAYKGIVRDGTIFKKLDKDSIKKDLASIGFNSNGTERMFNGMTGKFMDVELFIAPIYYQTLQKFTNDSLHSHKKGATDAITHQPIEGKSNGGSLKIGNMETDVFTSSGSLEFLNEKLMEHSDKFDIYVCKNCGKRAIVNEEINIYRCNRCKNNAKIQKCHFGWANNVFLDELESSNIGIKLGLETNKKVTQLEGE